MMPRREVRNFPATFSAVGAELLLCFLPLVIRPPFMRMTILVTASGIVWPRFFRYLRPTLQFAIGSEAGIGISATVKPDPFKGRAQRVDHIAVSHPFIQRDWPKVNGVI